MGWGFLYGEIMSENPIKIAVILEGGVVQAVVTKDPALTKNIEIVIIDYDVQGEDASSSVPQGNGEMTDAWVYEFVPSKSEIDIDGIVDFDEAEDEEP